MQRPLFSAKCFQMAQNEDKDRRAQTVPLHREVPEMVVALASMPVIMVMFTTRNNKGCTLYPETRNP